MSLQSKQEVAFLFELLTEGTHEADIALANAIEQEVSVALYDEGYRTQSGGPPLTLEESLPRGGAFLTQFITFVTNAAVAAWVYRDTVLADASGLVTVCMGVVPVLRRLFQSHKQHAKQADVVPRPLKITVEIDGAAITIEAADVKDAKAALKLAQRFLKQHPTVARKATTHSSRPYFLHNRNASDDKRLEGGSRYV
ncbi:MAG TPA: hypothetical protein VH593_32275 [Ktedonobacteraceae bacterium]|jgi:hypothetical protein